MLLRQPSISSDLHTLEQNLVNTQFCCVKFVYFLVMFCSNDFGWLSVNVTCDLRTQVAIL